MTYVPAPIAITNITQAVPGVVTTDGDHGYSTGYAVRLIVPQVFGMNGLNNMIVAIEVLTSDTFAIYSTLIPKTAIDTRQYNPFVLATGLLRVVAQAVPAGEFPTIFDSRYGIYDSPISDQVNNIQE